LRVALLTYISKYHNLSLGGALQAYALQYAIKSILGEHCDILDYYPSQKLYKQLLNSLRYKGLGITSEFASYLIKNIKQHLGFTLRKGVSTDYMDYIEKERAKNIQKFKEHYINFTSRTYHSISELKLLDYDIYVVGSDLVWNPRYHSLEALNAYLLSFVKRGLKASYGASIGENIPRWAQNIFKHHLKEFNFISVREETSKRVLERLGINAEIVCDPTLLLDAEEWRKISRIPKEKIDEPYVLVYNVYKPSELLRLASQIEHREGLKIVTYFPHSGYYSFYSSGPQEFLWLIDNADYVITSSFHGTIFAIIFKKPFYAINPSPEAPPSRISDLLEQLELKERFIYKLKDLRYFTLDYDIDWNAVKKIIRTMRLKSTYFLKKLV